MKQDWFMWLCSLVLITLVLALGFSKKSYAETNTVSSTVVTNSTPPTANAPSIINSNSDNITFNSTYVTSTYTNYIIKYSRVIPQTDQTTLNFQVSVDNGSTINGDAIVGEQYTNMVS